jgi:hypothetical protein
VVSAVFVFLRNEATAPSDAPGYKSTEQSRFVGAPAERRVGLAILRNEPKFAGAGRGR